MTQSRLLRTLLAATATLLFTASCSEKTPSPDPDPDPTPSSNITLPAGEVYAAASEGGTVEVAMQTSGAWSVASSTTWCTPTTPNGSGNSTLRFTVDPNTSLSARSATLTISASSAKKSFTISQKEATSPDLYELPVIFHTMGGAIDHIKLTRLLKECNDALRGRGVWEGSVDMGVELYFATHNPDGVALATPGVNYSNKLSGAQDPNVFLMEESNVKYIWDPNNYINVEIFPFTEENLLGVAHLAFNPSASGLGGLQNGVYFISNPADFPYSVTLNETVLFDQEPHVLEEEVYGGSRTLAHELGHLLGLLHNFVERDAEGNTPTAPDIDYCPDTYQYNRTDYNAWLETTFQPEGTTPYSFEAAIKRTTSDGETVSADNIMDYDYCRFNRFTADQAFRVAYVVRNSPLIPGPKIRTAAMTRAALTAERPTPRIVECWSHTAHTPAAQSCGCGSH